MAQGLELRHHAGPVSKNMDAQLGRSGQLPDTGSRHDAERVRREGGILAGSWWTSRTAGRALSPTNCPFGKGRALPRATKRSTMITGGWSVNAVRSTKAGFPLSITQQSNNNSAARRGGQRPNATGVDPKGAGDLTQRLDNYDQPRRLLASAAVHLRQPEPHDRSARPGPVERGHVHLQDLLVFEGVKAQFRAEALNAFNTPLFRSPTSAFGNANFGRVTSQANFPRLIQFGVRFFL